MLRPEVNPPLVPIQHLIARYSTGGTFRGCQAGTTDRAREYLETLDLSRFSTASEFLFAGILDKVTEELQAAMPGHEWGFARKAVNIFLRDCFYNRYLHDRYELGSIESMLEIPLDNIVAEAIIASQIVIPRWRSITALDSRTSAAFQQAASNEAERRNCARIHLDAVWWGERSQKG